MPFEVIVPAALATKYASGAVTLMTTAAGATTTLVSTGTGAIVGTATLVPTGGAAAAGTTLGAAGATGAAAAGLATAVAVAAPLVLVGAAAIWFFSRSDATADVSSEVSASSDDQVIKEANAIVDDELASLQDNADDSGASTSV